MPWKLMLSVTTRGWALATAIFPRNPTSTSQAGGVWMFIPKEAKAGGKKMTYSHWQSSPWWPWCMSSKFNRQLQNGDERWWTVMKSSCLFSKVVFDFSTHWRVGFLFFSAAPLLPPDRLLPPSHSHTQSKHTHSNTLTHTHTLTLTHSLTHTHSL